MASPSPAGSRGAASHTHRSWGASLLPHPASSHASTRHPSKYPSRDPASSTPPGVKAPASILKAPGKGPSFPAGAAAASDAEVPRPRSRERRVQFAADLCSYSQERQAEADAALRLAATQEPPAAEDLTVAPGGEAGMGGEQGSWGGAVQEAAKGPDKSSVVTAAAPSVPGAPTSTQPAASAVAATPAEAAAPPPAKSTPAAAAAPPAASAPGPPSSAAAVPAPTAEAAPKAASAPSPAPAAAAAAPTPPPEATVPPSGPGQGTQHPRSTTSPPAPLAAPVAPRSAPPRDSAAPEKQAHSAHAPLSKNSLPADAGPGKWTPHGKQAQLLLNHASSPPMSPAGMRVPISPLMPPPGAAFVGVPFSPLVPPPWMPPPSPKPPGPGSLQAPKPSKLPVRTAQGGALQPQQGPSLRPRSPLGAPPRAGTAAGAAGPGSGEARPSHTAGAPASNVSAAPAPSPAPKPAAATTTGPAPAPATPLHAPAPTPGLPTNPATPSRAPAPAQGMRLFSAPPSSPGPPSTPLPQSSASSPTPGRGPSHMGPPGASPPVALLPPELQARLQVLCSDAALLPAWESAFSELGYTKSEPSTTLQEQNPTDVPMDRTTSLTANQPEWSRKLVVGPSSPSPASTPRVGAGPSPGSHMRAAPTWSQPGTPNAWAPHPVHHFRASPLLVGPHGAARNEQLGSRSPATPRRNPNTAQYTAPGLGPGSMAGPKYVDAERPSSADGARPSALATAAAAAAAAPRSATPQPQTSRPMTAGPGMGTGRSLPPAGLLGSGLVVGPGARGAVGPAAAPSTPRLAPSAAPQGARPGGSVPSSPVPGPMATEPGRRAPASPLSHSAQQPRGNLQAQAPVPGPVSAPRGGPPPSPGPGSAPALPQHARPVGAAGPQRRLGAIPEAHHPQVLPPPRQPLAGPAPGAGAGTGAAAGAGRQGGQAPGMGMRRHARSRSGQDLVITAPAPAGGRPATADSKTPHASREGPVQQVPVQKRSGTAEPPRAMPADGRRQLRARPFSSMPYALPALFRNKPTSPPGKATQVPLPTPAELHQGNEPSTPEPANVQNGLTNTVASMPGAPAPAQRGAAPATPAAVNEGAHEAPRPASPLGLHFPGTIRTRVAPPSPARRGLTTARADASPRTSFLRSLLHGQMRMTHSPPGPGMVTSPGGSAAESEAHTPPPPPDTPAPVGAAAQAPRPASADPSSYAHTALGAHGDAGQRAKGSPGGGKKGLWLWPASPLLGRKAPAVEAVCTPRIGQLGSTMPSNGYKGSASPQSVLSEQLSDGSRPWSPWRMGTDGTSTSSRTSSVASPNPGLRYSSAATSASISTTAINQKNLSLAVSQPALPLASTAAPRSTQHAGPVSGKERGAVQAALVLQPTTAASTCKAPVPYQPVVDVGRYSWPEEGLARG